MKEPYGVALLTKKEKYAAELPFFEDAPDVPVSSASIIAEGQEIMHRNAARPIRDRISKRLQAIAEQALRNKQAKENRVNEIRSMLEMAERDLQTASNEADLAGFNFQKASQQVIEPDESTGDIERKLNEIESVNAMVKSNASKQAANKTRTRRVTNITNWQQMLKRRGQSAWHCLTP